jgi:hypothetical protein
MAIDDILRGSPAGQVRIAVTTSNPETMCMLKRIVAILGLLLVVSGLIWAAQGSGYFPYPAESFMIDQRPWIFRGFFTSGLGLAALMVSRYL